MRKRACSGLVYGTSYDCPPRKLLRCSRLFDTHSHRRSSGERSDRAADQPLQHRELADRHCHGHLSRSGRRGLVPFSWTLLARRRGPLLGRCRIRHRHGVPPAADAPRLQVPKWVEYFFTVCGTLALEGGPIFWVATHRIHHQHSDTKAIRTRRAKAHSGRTWDGSSPARRHHNNTDAAGPLRARPRQRSVLPLADHVALGAADVVVGLIAARARRLADGAAGASSCASSSACTRPGW